MCFVENEIYRTEQIMHAGSVIQNVSTINQNSLKEHYRFAIRHGENCLVLGPSGCGKTECAIQAIEEEGAQCIYWNLSVTERPDIQGIPKISENGLSCTYAAPEKLPFIDIRAQSINQAAKYFTGDTKNYLQEIAQKLNLYEEYSIVDSALKYITNSDVARAMKSHLEQLMEQLNNVQASSVVILFDEVDKAPQEVLQPLLELLQFRTINGRKLFVKACILTGNLPDEHCHSEPLNHAITNRGLVFQLEPSFPVWLQWALSNELHELVTGFLAYEENQEFFLKRPKNNQIYNYAYPTPRGWTEVSKLLYKFEKDTEFARSITNTNEFQKSLIESKVGVEAAVRLSTWLQYYRALDPTITAAFEGRDPSINDLSVDELLVSLIGTSSRFVAWARKRKENLPLVHEKAREVFSWINKANMDLKIAALRGTCDVNLFLELKLEEFPITAAIWEEIVKVASGQDDEPEQKEEVKEEISDAAAA